MTPDLDHIFAEIDSTLDRMEECVNQLRVVHKPTTPAPGASRWTEEQLAELGNRFLMNWHGVDGRYIDAEERQMGANAMRAALTSLNAAPAAGGGAERELLGEAWGALNFILAFYDPGQRHLDTNAWKQAEADGRRIHAKLRAFLDSAPPAQDQPKGAGDDR